jgi:uncharacterized membrane protein YqjE
MASKLLRHHSTSSSSEADRRHATFTTDGEESSMRDHPSAVDADDLRNGAGEQPSLVDALERVAQASLDVVDRRVELIQLEIKSVLTRSITGAMLIVAALALLVIAWLASLAAGFLALRDVWGDLGSVAAIAGLNLVLGLVAARIGVKSLSPST